jgi:pimeloyl-ACP methyl ester carboxylesterase
MSRIMSVPSACVALLLLPAGPVLAAPPSLKDLTPAVRARIDRLAEQQPLDTLRQEKLNMAGNVSLWALGHLALAQEDELEHVQAVHKQILTHEKIVPTPPAAERVFRKLLDNLPPHLKPDVFEYKLIMLDQPEANVFTLGGGLVYVSQPLIDALLADAERGEAALAFVLGNQLGHIGLQDCRRGWQSFELEQELQKGIELNIARPQLREVLHTTVETVSGHAKFLYSRQQTYSADLFAWQLCRNSGIALDPALDGLRWLAVVEHPRIRTDEAYRPDPDAPGLEGPSSPPGLLRLRRMFMERDGGVDDPEGNYGLFLWDPRSDTFARCARQSVGADDRPVVFVHGFRGTMQTFRDYLPAFADHPGLRGRKLLVFRYPNNTSLGRCGQFLHNEMRRVVMAPEKAAFVCHSAGGLVFRWYCEVRKGPFDRAVLLSTPNEGTSLGSLKYLADLTALFDELKMNGPGALARMVPEGEGDIVYDVHEDSLFLRYLGHNAEMAKHYHVFSGEFLRPGEVLGLGVAITAAKRVMGNRVLPRIESPVLRRQALRRIERWHLPSEISRGDLIVSVRSALLKDAGHATRTALNHEQFKSDELVIRDVMESIQGK